MCERESERERVCARESVCVTEGETQGEREKKGERDLGEVPAEGAERARKVVHLREVVTLVEHDLIHHVRFSQPRSLVLTSDYVNSVN